MSCRGLSPADPLPRAAHRAALRRVGLGSGRGVLWMTGGAVVYGQKWCAGKALPLLPRARGQSATVP